MRELRRWTLGAALALAATAAQAEAPDPADWAAVEDAARGQQVYWAAWGGEPRINAYIAWVADEVDRRFAIELTHVKVSDIADTVSRVLAEKVAGNTTDGAVDLMWINGENFAAMKRQDLLFGPWAEALPNFALTNPDDNPAMREDFTVPVEGYEAPWGKAQLTFFYDSAFEPDPPRSIAALGEWAEANPGRFTYPMVPNFLGSTFLKQALIALAPERAPLDDPVDAADYAAMTAPLWDYLDALHPNLWRGGRDFPSDGGELRRLLGDGEITIAFDFDPVAASAAIEAGELPSSVRGYALKGGTIGNVNFTAIPFNSGAKAAAMVVANFLLSPEAQARKQDPAVWGGFTVLDLDALAAEERDRFEALDLGVATPTPSALGAPLPEPHPSWMARLEDDWRERYGAR
ncbi:MAG: ABC transporter substrate-binding protein [Alphaproteobacteria bacterium]